MLSCFLDKYVCAKIICFYIWFVWIAIWGKLIILPWGALHEKPLFSGAFLLGPQNVDGRPWASWGSGYLPRSLLAHTIAPFPTQRHPDSQEDSFIGEKKRNDSFFIFALSHKQQKPPGSHLGRMEYLRVVEVVMPGPKSYLHQLPV